jgi:hypothetical protein
LQQPKTPPYGRSWWLSDKCGLFQFSDHISQRRRLFELQVFSVVEHFLLKIRNLSAQRRWTQVHVSR